MSKYNFGVDETFRPILSRINQHINYQGYTIRRCYKQFDVQNIGKVSESQFYRAFPGPKDITEAELCAIAKRYSVPNDPGMVDYLRLEQDLRDLAQAELKSKEGYPPKVHVTTFLQPDEPDIHINTKAELLVPSVHMVLERIGFAVHTRGIRLLDHFLDYDPLRHDEVSEHQFACVLNLALSEAAQLSRFDIQQLANFFRSGKNSDKIAYREFCRAADFRNYGLLRASRILDLAFHTMDLEKKPLCKPEMPPHGALSRVRHLTMDIFYKVNDVFKLLFTNNTRFHDSEGSKISEAHVIE
ncbi:unnamed protein product [Dibothriocephalus latus]|uniref:EF-hand domain-containing protein n=1 Tax=Dibothriocephalus latus TaxID=60516 RepID=A0A3P7LN95_DIBLA|nr:unnamed protein product [Dibothriocephalus latus]